MVSHKRERRRSALHAFLTSEASGGILLMAAALLAMIVANSGWADLYHHVLHQPLGPELTRKLGPMTLHLWINDGLMAFFFLLVGLEIKREFLDGQLASWEKRRLPVLAAASGMALPAIVYLAVSGGDPVLVRGWAIPAATDIAFAIGVLALLGSRAPASLKLFLTAVAIVDDMGAAAIIALAYTAAIDTLAVGAAAAIWLTIYAMGKSGVRTLWPFLVGALLLWYAVLLSGVHATIAGVLAAAAIPIKPTPGAPDAEDSPLHRLEHGLSPWVAYLIVPLFGFANAGLSLRNIGGETLFGPLPLAVAAGLFLGKQTGIFAAVWIAVKLGWARKFKGTTWLQIYGVSLLCGIGFTMSLFIGALAFADQPRLVEEAKAGILAGSLLSAIAGYAVLRLAPIRGPDQMPLVVAPVAQSDIPALHALVESAYRGDSARRGWTHEADLVAGERTDRESLAALIDAEEELLLVARQGGNMVGCVQLTDRGEGVAYLGLLCVDPARQADGIGKRIIAAAEAQAAARFGAKVIEMTVISVRDELIAYYERRGYRRTGETRPFPILLDPPLQFVVLERHLA